jgi:hypothetical protein
VSLLTPADYPAELALQPPAHRRFLDYVGRHPEGLRPEPFAALGKQDNAFLKSALQPWPAFIDREHAEKLERASVDLCRIIKALPERIFQNDPEAIADFYGLDHDTARVATSYIARVGRLQETTARGDFIDTLDGFRCIELNVAGNLGGFEVPVWFERYARIPYLQDYFRESGLRFRVTDSMRELFSHVIDGALRLSAAGEPVSAVLGTEKVMAREWTEKLAAVYGEVAATRGRPGRFAVAPPSTLIARDGRIFYGGWGAEERVSLLIEATGALTLPVFGAAMSGTIDVHVGPPSRLLSDKLNLALLSEAVETGDEWLTEEERRTVEATVPWTRRVAEEFVTWRGERVYLPDLLVSERERLILKLGYSLGGRDVYSGRGHSAAGWSEVLRTALGQGGWVVQELQTSRPYLFQGPEGGCMPHDVTWGPFVCGDRYCGCFLRLQPSGGSGIINVGRGATQGLFLDVESPLERNTGS